ncbi:MAG: cupin domain-containing protein [Alphaproteobacteria bacterium]|nr:cupin domain-containing protein [Alphaproteobacteria bacterium]
MDRFTLSQARDAVTQALEAGTAPMGLPAAQPFAHGTMKLYFYRPRGEDKQPPHEQDEVYVVVRGTGAFAVGPSEEALKRIPFGPGDAIFAPAGAVHRFEDFSDDFETWVIMYGPEGGETPG